MRKGRHDSERIGNGNLGKIAEAAAPHIPTKLKQLARPFKYIKEKIATYAKAKFDDWFYFHEVLGQNGETIYALKFRTMYKGANEVLERRVQDNGIDELGKPNDEKLVIPERAWMRRRFFDEIPQLFYNVMHKKNMKMVGIRPRPGVIWFNYIREGLTTQEDLDETLKEKPGLWGVQYRYPKLSFPVAEKIWREFKKLRPGSADLNYWININYLIIIKKLRSK